jgi:hypothetical protein
MIYEYTITCLKCGYRVASGNFSTQVDLSNADVMNKAEHNPGCLVPANRDASKIRITNNISTYDHAIVTEYSIEYRNR